MSLRYFLVFAFLLSAKLSVSVPSDSTTVKDKAKLIFLPVLYSSPETRLALGAASSLTFRTKTVAADTLTRTSSIQVLGLKTFRKQTITGLDGTIYFPKETYILRFHGSYTNYPDKFWGVGNNTPNLKHPIPFSYSQFYIYPQLMRRVYSHFFVGVSFEVQRLMRFNCPQGGLFDSPEVVGTRTSNINGGGLIASWDNRNNAFSPTKGAFFEVTLTNFNSFFGSHFQYTNYTVDARKYFLIGKKDVLAFQAYGYFNNGKVPFLSLAALGGSYIMRGYYSGRFRDKDLVVTQAEYRMHVWRKFGMVGFAGIGQVARNTDQIVEDERRRDLPPNHYKVAGGWGLRYALREKERLNLRVDFGFARHSQGTYITVSEAF
jgi:hypothetical protein